MYTCNAFLKTNLNRSGLTSRELSNFASLFQIKNNFEKGFFEKQIAVQSLYYIFYNLKKFYNLWNSLSLSLPLSLSPSLPLSLSLSLSLSPSLSHFGVS